jgi:uncharacterized protein
VLEHEPRRGATTDGSGRPAARRDPGEMGRGRAADPLARLVEAQIRSLVLDGPFPCSGAKAAFNDDSYRFNLYPNLGDSASWIDVAADLTAFVRGRSSMGRFYTFVASFVEPAAVVDHAAWDRLVWAFLQGLHDVDDVAWDPRFSTDPSSADFAFSFGGCGMLVVSLYPGATRYARRFAWPTIVFNPLEQDRANFPDHADLQRFTDRIRARDTKLQGAVNPSLPPTPDDPQAPGFSGAPVGAGWKCPLRVRPELR